MNKFISEIFQNLSTIDNTIFFGLSIIPYGIFLYYLFKIKIFNKYIKLGFSMTLLFVFITIICSILSSYIYKKTLIEVDLLHGLAESFLTLSDFIILYGFIRLFKNLEVKNS